MTTEKTEKLTAFTWPEKSKGYVDFHENVIFIYGAVKIGKTTLASKFSDAFFLLTEEGAKHVSISGWHIRNWADFCVRLDTIEKAVKEGQFPFKTIILDTADELVAYCDEFICNKYSLNVLGDLDYGKGTAYYSKEFRKQVRRITKLGLGLVFISHAAEKEVNVNSVVNPYAPMMADVTTGKVKMIVPSLERRAYEFISAMADMIFYLDIDKDGQRKIFSKPTKVFEAGDRSGRLPAVLPLDYDELLKAYYGESDADIIERINKAEQWLAEHQIDNFDQPNRANNSRKKHLGTETLNDAKIAQLESYLQHLRIKAKNRKETKNGEVSGNE